MSVNEWCSCPTLLSVVALEQYLQCPMSLDQTVFKKRRKEFLKLLGTDVAIIPGARLTLRNGDVEYEFRQESNFYYLTGLETPDAIAVFSPKSKKPFILFVRPRDSARERWIGPTIGIEEVTKIYGADRAMGIGNWKLEIENLLQNTSTIFYKLGTHPDVDQSVLRHTQSISATVADPLPLLAQLRLVKSPTEISAIQKAIDITAHAYTECFKATRPGIKEYVLRATIEYAFRRRGSVRSAYPSIVASGAGTCILHNPHDRATIKNGSLVLIDAGAEWDYYSADITRTYPTNGTFTREQRAVYDIVLEAQERAIALVKPGARFPDIEDKTRAWMTTELLKKKILVSATKHRHPPHSNSLPKGRENPGVAQSFFPHRLGHWVGLDVHDAGAHDTMFTAGMVLTIEPGIYLQQSDSVNPEYWGIGVRIEDDILVTKKGNQNLSRHIPKEPGTLERVLKRNQQ